MSSEIARVADLLETHADHVWGRLPFLGAMAARVDRERGGAGRLTGLIVALHDLLFAHLDREDRVLLAIASHRRSPELDRGAARLRLEHAVVAALLDELRSEMARTVEAAGRAERALRAELAELDTHLRAQIRLEDAMLSG